MLSVPLLPTKVHRQAGSPCSPPGPLCPEDAACLPTRQTASFGRAKLKTQAGGQVHCLLLFFSLYFGSVLFASSKARTFPRYKPLRLVPGSQDKALPVCPADLSRGFKKDFSFLRVKMEEIACSEHHHFTPISPAVLPPLNTRFTPDGMQQNYCSPQAKTSFWLELSHALPPAQMCAEDLVAGSKLSHIFADPEERLLHGSLAGMASARRLHRCPFGCPFNLETSLGAAQSPLLP